MGSGNNKSTHSRQTMGSLLASRKEALTLYNELATFRPFTDESEVKVVLQEFCESLMDYTASAHFQLYRFIEDGTERRTNVREMAEEVYPIISKTTGYFLDFNEKYESDEKCDHLSALADDLSGLGEALADRILYEDQVISAYEAPKVIAAEA